MGLPGYGHYVSRSRPVALVLVAIASVQFGAVVAKSAFTLAHPVTLAFLRGAIAGVVFVVIARPRLRGRSRSDWLVATAYGLCLSGMNTLIYLSFARIPVGLAVTLEFVGPLALAVAGSRRLLDLMWVAFAVVGVLLLGAGPTEPDHVGVALALGAGGLWAGYIALAGPLGRRWPGTSGLTTGSLIGTAVLAAPGIALAGDAWADPRVPSVMTLVALLSTVIPYALELQARRSIKAGTFGILMSLEPAAAAVFAWLVLGEWLNTVEWLAMAMVIAASVGTVRSARIGRPPGQDTLGYAGSERL